MNPAGQRFVTTAMILGALGAAELGRADCWFLPPGGAYATGLHEVYKGQSFANTPEVQDIVWLADGRVAAGYNRYSTFYPKGAVIRITETVTKDILFDSDSHISPPDEARAVNCYFGRDLTASGDFIATSFYAAASASNPADAGAVAIYKRGETGHYALEDIVYAPTPETDDGFGAELAMSANWLAVGDSGFSSKGGIRMFEREETGEWVLRTTLQLTATPSETDANWLALDIDGERLVVGQYRDGPANFSGRVDIWRWQNGAWEAEKTLAGDAAGDRFGYSVDLAGDFLFVGASQDSRAATNHGSVAEYRFTADDWVPQGVITLPEPPAETYLGVAVSYSADGGYLGVGALRGFHLLRREGDDWKYLGQNGGGNAFYDWESPAGTVKDYIIGDLDDRPGTPAQRGTRTVAEFGGRISLLEFGTHRITTRRVEPLDECIWQPTGYAGNGGASVGPDDEDGDGRSDLSEGYFGTIYDVSNLLDSDMKLSGRSGDGVLAVRWPRAPGVAESILAEAQWSSDLIAWTSEEVVVAKVGTDPETGRDIMEASLPEPTEGQVYFRLQFIASEG